jgi:tetratricopeptide (TPR) repeat protein
MPPRRLLRLTLPIAGALLLVGTGLTVIVARLDRPSAPADVPGPANLAARSGARLDTAIDAAQVRLRRLPKDWSTWAQLGSAYVERARITADPTYYPKAQGALQRSLHLESATNWQAMVGMGALSNARHDFRAGLDWGRRAQRVNPSNGSVYGVIADALTQLGQYPQARDAVQQMLNVAPGVPSFARASYDFEQHGQVAQARDALNRALQVATDPADIAFCRYYLGELAFNNGDLAEARRQYEAGLAADSTYQMLHAGMARVDAASGRTDQAIKAYDKVVQQLPLPQLVAEYGDLLTIAGQQVNARRQYDLFGTEQQLFTANGVADHLTFATFLADHGQPARSLTEAQAEWKARGSVMAADALAWALHRNGRHEEALTYATTATRLGWRNATFLYHRGAIEAALGKTGPARADINNALTINPHFDVLQVPVARRLLASLGGPK